MASRWISLWVAALVLGGCPAHQERKKKMTDARANTAKPAPPWADDSPKTPWRVDYGDGSGNSFRFWQTGSSAARYTYEPMTPARSSSGTYSGGKPAQGTLEPRLVRKLWRWLRRAEGDTARHAASRKMGTGSFVFTSPDGKGKFLMERSALESFEALIKPLRGDRS